jgi:hypothetical protein
MADLSDSMYDIFSKPSQDEEFLFNQIEKEANPTSTPPYFYSPKKDTLLEFNTEAPVDSFSPTKMLIEGTAEPGSSQTATQIVKEGQADHKETTLEAELNTHRSQEGADNLYRNLNNRSEAVEFEERIKKTSGKKETIVFDEKILAVLTKSFGLLATLKEIGEKHDNSQLIKDLTSRTEAIVQDSERRMVVEPEKCKKQKLTLLPNEAHGYIRFHLSIKNLQNRLSRSASNVSRLSQKKGSTLFIEAFKNIGEKPEIEETEVELKVPGCLEEKEGKLVRIFDCKAERQRKLIIEAIYDKGPVSDLIFFNSLLKILSEKLYSAIKNEISVKHLNFTENFLQNIKIYNPDEEKEKKKAAALNTNDQSEHSVDSKLNLEDILENEEEQLLLRFNDLYSIDLVSLYEMLERLFIKYPKINSIRLEELLRRADFFYYEPGVRQLVNGMYRIMLYYMQRVKIADLWILRTKQDDDSLQSLVMLERKSGVPNSEIKRIVYHDLSMLIYAEGITGMSLVFEHLLEKVSMKNLMRCLRKSGDQPVTEYKPANKKNYKHVNKKNYNEMVPPNFVDGGNQQPSEPLLRTSPDKAVDEIIDHLKNNSPSREAQYRPKATPVKVLIPVKPKEALQPSSSRLQALQQDQKSQLLPVLSSNNSQARQLPRTPLDPNKQVKVQKYHANPPQSSNSPPVVSRNEDSKKLPYHEKITTISDQANARLGKRTPLCMEKESTLVTKESAVVVVESSQKKRPASRSSTSEEKLYSKNQNKCSETSRVSDSRRNLHQLSPKAHPAPARSGQLSRTASPHVARHDSGMVDLTESTGKKHHAKPQAPQQAGQPLSQSPQTQAKAALISCPASEGHARPGENVRVGNSRHDPQFSDQIEFESFPESVEEPEEDDFEIRFEDDPEVREEYLQYLQIKEREQALQTRDSSISTNPKFEEQSENEEIEDELSHLSKFIGDPNVQIEEVSIVTSTNRLSITGKDERAGESEQSQSSDVVLEESCAHFEAMDEEPLLDEGCLSSDDRPPSCEQATEQQQEAVSITDSEVSLVNTV